MIFVSSRTLACVFLEHNRSSMLWIDAMVSSATNEVEAEVELCAVEDPGYRGIAWGSPLKGLHQTTPRAPASRSASGGAALREIVDQVLGMYKLRKGATQAHENAPKDDLQIRRYRARLFLFGANEVLKSFHKALGVDSVQLRQRGTRLLNQNDVLPAERVAKKIPQRNGKTFAELLRLLRQRFAPQREYLWHDELFQCLKSARLDRASGIVEYIEYGLQPKL